MRNEPELAGHLRTIAPLTGADLLEAGLEPSPHYQGPAQCFPKKEAAALLVELARYFTEPQPVQYADCYFIGGAEGPIKIGIASTPAKRLKQLQVGYPSKLELLAVIPGGALQEPAYHARFAAHRLNGEWFERCPEILAEIERLSIPARETVL